MSISFNEIPLNILTPGSYLEIDNSRAVQGTPAQPHVALLIGVLKASGTVLEGVPTSINSGDAAEGFFGVGSMLANMCRAFKKANAFTELWAIGLDETTTAHTRTLTFGGSATADGTVVVYIAGHRIETAVTSGDAAAAVSTAVSAAIVAYAGYSRLPFTSAEATSVTTLTATQKGIFAEEIDVRHSYGTTEALPAGITLAIADGVAGVGQEAMATAITAMGDVQYHTVGIAATDATSLTAIEAEMLTRFGAMEQKEGHVFAAALGTQSTLTTLGNTRNSKHLTIVSTGGVATNSPTPLYEVAAIAAAVSAAETEKDPARPRTTVVMTGMLPQPPEDQFTRTERNTLLTDGISTTTVDGGGLVRVERVITTYQTNPLSVPDPSYLDETTLRNLSRLRYDVRVRISLKFPRHKLANDGTLFDPGQAVVTPSSIKAELIALFRIWEGAALVEGSEQFATDLIVERSTSDVNRVDMRMSPDLINKFAVFAGQVQFLL